MPLNVVFLRPQNWSRLKPYYESTITAIKGWKNKIILYGRNDSRATVVLPEAPRFALGKRGPSKVAGQSVEASECDRGLAAQD